MKRAISAILSLVVMFTTLPIVSLAKSEFTVPDSMITVEPTMYGIQAPGISGRKITFEKWKKDKIIGNIACAHTEIDGTTYYYIQNLNTGKIIYESTERFEVDRSYKYDKNENLISKASCDIVSIRFDDYYDFVNVRTGEYFDYHVEDFINLNSDGDAISFINDCSIVIKDKKCALLSSNGSLLTDFEYDGISHLGYGIFIGAKYDEEGYIIEEYILNSKGNQIFNAYHISDGVYFKKNSSMIHFTYYNWEPREEGCVVMNSDGEILNQTIEYDGEYAYSPYGERGAFNNTVICGSIKSDFVFDEWDNEYVDCDSSIFITSDGTKYDLTEKFGGMLAAAEYIGTGTNNESLFLVTTYNFDYLSFNYSNGTHMVNQKIPFYGIIDENCNVINDLTSEYVEYDSYCKKEYTTINLGRFNNGYGDLVYGGEETIVDINLNRYFEYDDNTLKRSQFYGKYFYDTNSNNIFDIHGNVIANGEKEYFSQNIMILKNDSEKLGFLDTTTGIFSGFVVDTFKYNDVYVLDKYVVVEGEYEENSYKSCVYDFAGEKVLEKLCSFSEYHISSNGNIWFGAEDEFVLYNSDLEEIYRTDNVRYIDNNTDCERLIIEKNNYNHIFIDYSGKVILNDTFYKHIEGLGNDYFYACSTYSGQIPNQDCRILDSNGNILVSILSGGKGFDYYALSCGTTTLSSEDFLGDRSCYYQYWFEEFKSNDGLELYTENNSLGVNEITEVYCSYSNSSYFKSTEDFEVTSSNEKVLKVLNKNKSITSAYIKGISPGTATLTFTFDSGITVSKDITVELSTKNMLEHFPTALSNSSLNAIFDGAEDCYTEILNTYTSSDNAVISYFTALKNGGAKVLTKSLMSTFGITNSYKDDYVDEAVLQLMQDFCETDNSFAEIEKNYSSKWSKFKNYFKAGSISLSEYCKSLSSSSGISSNDILSFANELTELYGDNIKLIDETVTIIDIVTALVSAKQINVAIINQMLECVKPGTELYEGLTRLKAKTQTTLLSEFFKEYLINETLINNLASNLAKNILNSNDIYVKLADFAIKLAVTYYTSQGGITADKLTKAIYMSSFATQFKCALINIQTQFIAKNYNEETFSDYEFVYNAYLSSTKAALSCAKDIVKSKFRYQKDEADKYIQQLNIYCSFEDYINSCKNEALNLYEKEYVCEKDKDGKTVIVGYYTQLPESRKTRARSSSALNSNAVSKESILVIPSTINGNKIIGISKGAFSGNKNIETVLIPDSVEYIGESAFEGCTNLKTVIMGNNVVSIGDYAFKDCSVLKDIVFSKNLKSIGIGSFSNCESINSFEFPQTIDSFESNSFDGMTSLTTVVFKGNGLDVDDDCFKDSKISEVYGHRETNAKAFAEANEAVYFELNRYLTDLSIVSTPNKTKYYLGEELDETGMQLKATYSDGEESIITEGWLSVVDSSAIGVQNVSVCFGNLITTYRVEYVGKDIENISLEPELTMSVGEKIKLLPALSPANSVGRVYWESDNENIVKVSKSGELYAIKSGSAVITAYISSEIAASCMVTVTGSSQVILEGEHSFSYGNDSFIFIPEINAEYMFEINSGCVEFVDEKGITTIINPLESQSFYLEKNKVYQINLQNCNYICISKQVFVKSLEIISMPYLTEYTVYYNNNDLNFDGLALKAFYEDGSFEIIDCYNSDLVFNYPAELKEGKNIVEVAYFNSSTNFEIFVTQLITEPSTEPNQPTKPSTQPTTKPSVAPTTKPTSQLTTQPNTTKPIAKPTVKPTQKPTVKPSHPTVKPCAHTTVIKNYKKATYFANGYSGDTICVKCKKTITKGKVVAKLTLKTPGFKLTKGKKQFKVKYTVVNGASGFKVRYKLKGKWKTKTYNSTKTVTKAIKKLKKGKYSVQVIAFVEQSGVKVYSSWSKTKKVKIT